MKKRVSRSLGEVATHFTHFKVATYFKVATNSRNTISNGREASCNARLHTPCPKEPALVKQVFRVSGQIVCPLESGGYLDRGDDRYGRVDGSVRRGDRQPMIAHPRCHDLSSDAQQRSQSIVPILPREDQR